MAFIRKVLSSKIGKILLISFGVYIVVSFLISRISKRSGSRSLKKVSSILSKPFSFGSSESDIDGSEIQTDALSVSVITVSQKPFTPSVNASGVVDYMEKVDVFSKIAGRIEKMYVKEGEEVSLGQKLFKMETMPLELELMKQEATMESSKAQVKLAKEKYEKAKGAVIARIHEYEKAKTILEKNRQDLEKSKVTFQGIEEIYKAGGFSREEFENAKLNLNGKESAYQIAERDLEIKRIGLTDEDIIRNGLAVPDTKEERTKTLQEINTLMEKAELEVAEGVYKAHAAQAKSTNLLLKESIAYSPINGVVAKQFKTEGELLASSGSGQHVLSVINVRYVYATFNVPESESVQLKRGMKVDFSADVYKKVLFSGKVQLISPLIDQKSHTVEIKAIVDNGDKRLKPGMFIRANVSTGTAEPSIVLPNTSVLFNEDGITGSVFVVRDGKAYKAELKLGQQKDGNVVVQEGLQTGDLVVTDRLSQLRSGISVNPISSDR
ncbi:efflux RND transporter periplasmic adaptor subunit [Leptospira andrefontaineae]|uniref:Efflux RND transporter periplasmic adaptor subunit n=1 Tax=Leptospira andrefontaineae TaxID=2484976 RepID=A0A4R9HAG5_9LEPT|nr:efflux RND transporter periplasmic adaptor subunit [Leptospira andrefontaineae]TGK43533.1 efflux RND transporter periplasmic adaptor subunit [Leptospira andrefontaineae]